MNNRLQNAYDVRIITVTSVVTATPLATLVKARLATLGKSLPIGLGEKPAAIIGIAITPSADIELSDIEYGDNVKVTSGTRRELHVLDALNKYSVANAADVDVEIFFDR